MASSSIRRFDKLIDKFIDMKALASLLHHAPSALKASDRPSAALSDDITPSPDLPWDLIGPAEDSLLRELEKMYWDGVRQELEVIILTLRRWQRPEFNFVELSDENDDFIHGFDTFIDQVSQESRAFATRYGIYKFFILFLFYFYILYPLQSPAVLV